MQTSSSGQRPSQSQRRQHNLADSSQLPTQPMNPTAGTSVQSKASSTSGRSQKSSNPDKQISQIEKSVTHLLVATKQLLETLTQWSRNQAQEEEVSDVYVRLGYEFNLACRAFNSIGVETSDLGPVPDLLRNILEDTLSQPASPQALDNYLPRIRDIIINLLHGLKRKQSKLRGRGSRDASIPPRTSSGSGRQTSTGSKGSGETGLTQMLEEVGPSAMRSDSRQDSARLSDEQPFSASTASIAGPISRGSINRQSLRKDMDRPMPQSESSSSMSSNLAQNIPIIVPPIDTEERPVLPEVSFPHPPPPIPPKQQDALTALQRGGDLERRASRRFSSYQISKHLGASPNGVPVIPPAQNSPIPNRGRELRESMTAVRKRTSYQPSRPRPNSKQLDSSPSRSGTIRAPEMISEEHEDIAEEPSLREIPHIKPPTEPAQDDSPTTKTPDEYHKPPASSVLRPGVSDLDTEVNGQVDRGLEEEHKSSPTVSESEPPPPPQHQSPNRLDETTKLPQIIQHTLRSGTPPQSHAVEVGSSPPQGKELTLFLQYKSKIKKFVLSEGYDELTIARLQLAFLEKFAWNTHDTGAELPEIYIQDPVSGVRHELEDLSDVKDRSVLVLNVEVLDEVKKHFDDGIGGLRKTLDSFKLLLDGQGTMMQRFSDRQLEASKEMARMSAVPAQRPSRPVGTPSGLSTSTSSNASVQEVQNLRRDLAVLRQSYAAMSSDFANAMSDIKAKAIEVKAIAADAAVPTYKGDSGRTHINQGKKQLSRDSESLVNRVDDLSDLVEELRKDVVTRGVRPLPRQLEDISKEISFTAKELARVKDFVKKERPVWTKIWEQELQLVMTEREDLTQQDELIADLDGDLEDVNGIFKLVEEATKQQNLQNVGPGNLRSASKTLAFDTDIDPHEAKSGMLDEVRALQPNHENRLEAIERAEKARQKELQNRKGGAFQREVETFVEQGKLKKTGGADEVERIRKIRDEKSRKENWERQQARQIELEKKRAAEAAAAAAAATSSSTEKAADAEVNGPVGAAGANEALHGEEPFQDADEAGAHPEEVNHTNNEDEADRNDGPPQLPEVNISEQRKDSASEATSPTSPNRSWWQPAIFST